MSLMLTGLLEIRHSHGLINGAQDMGKYLPLLVCFHRSWQVRARGRGSLRVFLSVGRLLEMQTK